MPLYASLGKSETASQKSKKKKNPNKPKKPHKPVSDKASTGTQVLQIVLSSADMKKKMAEKIFLKATKTTF